MPRNGLWCFLIYLHGWCFIHSKAARDRIECKPRFRAKVSTVESKQHGRASGSGSGNPGARPRKKTRKKWQDKAAKGRIRSQDPERPLEEWLNKAGWWRQIYHSSLLPGPPSCWAEHVFSTGTHTNTRMWHIHTHTPTQGYINID